MEKLNKFLAWFVFAAYRTVMGLSWLLRACGSGLQNIGGWIYRGGLAVMAGGIYVVGWAEACATKFNQLDPGRKYPHEELARARDRVE